MQIAIHAAAPCPVEVKEKMIEWWGEIIMEYYAASEGIGFTLIDSAKLANPQRFCGCDPSGRVAYCR